MKLEPGAQVTPNVRLLRPLGEGGMGAVWIAEHRALGTEVAVKFLSGALLSNDSMRARFASEASAASQVKSSHVVKIYDHGITDSQLPFMVMELLEGEDLGARIRREGALQPAVVAQIVTQLCKALQAAHEKSVIHRDVKPENVFLTNEAGDLFVKLLDFGVAKNDRVSELTLKRSTMAGEALGTPYYMSPEQYRSSKGIDARADLWSVGVVAYEALTGHVPFDAENLTSLAIVVNEANATPPSQLMPSLPKAIDAWFAKACARERTDRFDDARELAAAFRAALAIERTSSVSIPDADTSQRLVVVGPDNKDISLQKTAFASTGSPTPKRSRLPTILGVFAVTSIVGTVLFVALRSNRVPEPRVVATDVRSSASAPASINEPPPPATSAAATATEPEPRPKASPVVVKPQTSKTTTPTTSASSLPSTPHDQIW